MTALHLLNLVLAIVGVATVIGGPVLFYWLRKEFASRDSVLTREQWLARDDHIADLIAKSEARIRTDLETAVQSVSNRVMRDVESMARQLEKSTTRSEEAFDMGRKALEGVTLAEQNVAGLKELFGQEFSHIRILLERNNKHP